MFLVVKLSDSDYYVNRELSWLEFNKRVLEEAMDSSNPLLERLKFLAIFSSNLDEFYMVRVAGLKDQVSAGFNKPDNKSGFTPREQLKKISERTHRLVMWQYETYENLINELKNEDIIINNIKDLTKKQLIEIENYFDEQIFPVLTPIAVDAYRPFPMLQNRSLNLAVVLDDDEEEKEFRTKLGIVQVPSVLQRIIPLQLEGEDTYKYIFLEEVITNFIGKLFVGYGVKSVTQIRITRNADMTIHEEGARDLLKEIEKELKKRRWGIAVRLEVSKKGLDSWVLDRIVQSLEVHSNDVYIIDGPLDVSFLQSFCKRLADSHEELVYQTHIPQPPKDLRSDEDIFEKVLEQDILIHHPYESFEPIIDFVTDAANDPNVLAIKQTLYRVSGDSPVIEALKVAAEKGKQVTVLVELKARFDEENNVQWAKELEKAGCHVLYGMNYLKTHSKITLVVRKNKDKIERFVHLGTGNYNDATAKFYTDMSLITTNRLVGIDATNFFNYLTGYTDKPHFHVLSVAPFDIREMFLEYIDREIDNQKEHKNGRIIAKMNSLTDKPIIKKLYEASQAGVKIDLIVRGICCLRPGIKGVSENIHVRSIVGRFLEHTRAFYFYSNGREEVFLSSADWMTRNMEKRIEIAFPILDKDNKKKVIKVLQLQLQDNVKSRIQQSDGTYKMINCKNHNKVDSQHMLCEMAYLVNDDEE